MRADIKCGCASYAHEAVTPSGERRAGFAVVVRDSRGGESFWPVEIEPAELRAACLVEARPGRGMALSYELAARKERRHGVDAWTTYRFLRALDVQWA